MCNHYAKHFYMYIISLNSSLPHHILQKKKTRPREVKKHVHVQASWISM